MHTVNPLAVPVCVCLGAQMSSMDVDLKGVHAAAGTAATKRRAANEAVVPDEDVDRRATKQVRRVVQAAGPADAWVGQQFPSLHQHNIPTPAGSAGVVVPQPGISGVPGFGGTPVDQKAIEFMNQHGPINHTFSVLPFASMIRAAPHLYRPALGDLPADQVEMYQLALHQPVWMDTRLERTDLSVPRGVALLSTSLLNRVLMVHAKACMKATDERKANPERELDSTEQMFTAAQLLNRFRLIGMLSNIDNPGPNLPSDRAVKVATITVARQPHSHQPNFWQAFHHSGLAGARMGFKFELINANDEVPWTIEECRYDSHSPFLAACPMPDQVIHKIRPGGAKPDDLISWAVIPQLVRNPKAWTDELAVACHYSPDTLAKNRRVHSGGGALVYYGMRNAESQWSSKPMAVQAVMMTLSPLTAEAIFKAQRCCNELFDRINCIIGKGVHVMGPTLPLAMQDRMYPASHRNKRRNELVAMLKGLQLAARVAPDASAEPAPPRNAAGAAAGGAADLKYPVPPDVEAGIAAPLSNMAAQAAVEAAAARERELAVENAARPPPEAPVAGGSAPVAGALPGAGANSIAAGGPNPTRGKGAHNRLTPATAGTATGRGRGRGRGGATGAHGRGGAAAKTASAKTNTTTDDGDDTSSDSDGESAASTAASTATGTGTARSSEDGDSTMFD